MNVYDEVSDEQLAEFVFARLTKRELEIVNMIYQGKITKQISVALEISDRTVDCHRYRIAAKLKLNGIAEYAVLGWRLRRWLPAEIIQRRVG